MRNDQNEILDSLLSEWHSWARSYSPVPTCGADPMFRNAKSAKGWDTTDQVMEDEIRDKTMKAIDFQVSEMKDPHRSAIHIHARNCCTGHNVWLSPRLPKDPMERTVILMEAKNQITRRLLNAGVM
ncbi:hypothetical protein [Acidovorax sp. LjRoot117]|uniref:hypothetical protein n=1 Tax=Acidovorax sp. LjRoot117 TaxID=3342255 RepID=UPI003ECEDC85